MFPEPGKKKKEERRRRRRREKKEEEEEEEDVIRTKRGSKAKFRREGGTYQNGHEIWGTNGKSSQERGVNHEEKPVIGSIGTLNLLQLGGGGGGMAATVFAEVFFFACRNICQVITCTMTTTMTDREQIFISF